MSADLLVSSLSKLFSGHANVLAGSLVVNSASPRARQLVELLTGMQLAGEIPPLFHSDANVLEKNSR